MQGVHLLERGEEVLVLRVGGVKSGARSLASACTGDGVSSFAAGAAGGWLVTPASSKARDQRAPRGGIGERAATGGVPKVTRFNADMVTMTTQSMRARTPPTAAPRARSTSRSPLARDRTCCVRDCLASSDRLLLRPSARLVRPPPRWRSRSPPARAPAASTGAAAVAAAPRQLQLCKLLYCLEGFSFASFGRVATLYYLSRGLDAHEIGLIEACRPATAIVGGVLFGGLSDRLRRKKAVYPATRVASTAVLLLLPAPFIGSSFPRILALNAGGGFVGVGIGVLDAYTLDLLGERSTEYGQYRLWLAVSWGVGNAVMGNVAQISFDYNFILFGGLTAIELVLIAAVLPARTRSELKARRRRPPPPPGGGARRRRGGGGGGGPRAPSLRRCCCRRASSSSWRR